MQAAAPHSISSSFISKCARLTAARETEHARVFTTDGNRLRVFLSLSVDFTRGCMVKSRSSPSEFRQDVDAQAELPVTIASSDQPLRFSSPMPWLLAIVLSVAIWMVIGWFVWRVIYG
jgi:hypothetical protein